MNANRLSSAANVKTTYRRMTVNIRKGTRTRRGAAQPTWELMLPFLLALLIHMLYSASPKHADRKNLSAMLNAVAEARVDGTPVVSIVDASQAALVDTFLERADALGMRRAVVV